MLAASKSSRPAELLSSGNQTVSVTVDVTMGNTMENPTFSYQGLGSDHSITIDHETAEVALTLSPSELPEGSTMTFVPIGHDETGPIVWVDPGTGDPVSQPEFITNLTLESPFNQLTFDVTNTATIDHDTLASFRLRVLLTGADRSETIFPSPDPTIINVDLPPGPEDSEGHERSGGGRTRGE